MLVDVQFQLEPHNADLTKVETLPDVSSIDIQTEIQWYMRPFLLDFLIEAHAAFQLLPETLYLAVNLLDRYCSKRVVYKRHYQLVGCASLLIASKYGDRKDRVPGIKELRSMCCGLYEDEMFTQMERHVLQTLEWAIGHPTIDSFLQLALSEYPYDSEVEHMTWFICEIALFDRDFVGVLPSVMARSALALARCILGKPLPSQSEWSGRYDQNVLVKLSEKVYSPSAVLQKKYGSAQFSYAANTMEIFLERQRRLDLERQRQLEMHRQSQVLQPIDVNGPAIQGYGLPHTPQKGFYATNIPHGLATPPITPDNDYHNVAAYMKAAQAVPRQFTATPTPPSSSEQQATTYQYRAYHYPQQPQQPQQHPQTVQQQYYVR